MSSLWQVSADLEGLDMGPGGDQLTRPWVSERPKEELLL